MSNPAKPALSEFDQNPQNVGARLSPHILRLVKSAPERQAIESGQVDAVIDPASGTVFLLPEAQQAQHEDQARIRGLLALSADWCWEQDENYRFVSHSGIATESSAPYDKGINGKQLWELPFHNMQEDNWDAHRMQLEWRFPFRDIELECTDRNDQICWVSISGEPIFDEQDEFKGYRGITRDITQRKQSEALAQISRETLAESSRDELPTEPEQAAAKGGPIANSLLAALPRKDYRNLLAGLSLVTLTQGQVLYEPGQPIRHVYFPNDCIVSLLTTVEGDKALEVGLVGRESMVGASIALGVDISSVRALVQATGTAMRMNATRFLKAVRNNLPLGDELNRLIHDRLAQARQTAACNRFHVVEERLACWLLMTSDRMQSDQFFLTHAFLANILGVRRMGVTEAARALQQRKLITYSRGNIRILDRKGLEAASCRCYETVKSMHEHTRAA